jgi:rhamnosyltransferase
MKKKLTVLIATYNGELFIKEQLDSILNQSFKDYKIVCRDDISIDNTFSILKDYQNNYPNIIEVYQNKKRLGVVSNFEKLIENSDTDYIALCDQDDIWHKDKLLISVNELNIKNNKTPLLFHSDLIMVDINLQPLNNSFFKKRGYAFPKKKSIDICLGRSGIMGNTMVFNKRLKDYILPFPKTLIVHDYWIALVNEAIGKRITYNIALINYRLHNKNTSLNLRKYSKKKFFNRDIILPYQSISREILLEEFLNRFTLDNRDVIITKRFIEYLYFKKSKFNIILYIFKYRFFRKGFFYKLKLIGAILWKKK